MRKMTISIFGNMISHECPLVTRRIRRARRGVLGRLELKFRVQFCIQQNCIG